MAFIALAPIKSTFISQYYSNSNFYGQPELYISRYKKSGDVYRTLIQFGFSQSLGSISKNNAIIRAELILTIIRNEIPRGSISVTVHKIWQAWTQSGVTWNTQPLFSISPEAVAIVNSGYLGRLHFDLSSLASAWKKGSQINYGLLLSGDEDRNRLLAFANGNVTRGSLLPCLQIEYE